MSLSPQEFRQYHVFLASPGDVQVEREAVRQFFNRFNRTIAQHWKVRFEVIDWENYATVGVGRPQALITQQTLEKYRDSLALVIGILAQRFGSPTGEADSGTEEEFNWAMESNSTNGYPEIKWFFRKVDHLQMPSDPDQLADAVQQWGKVLDFKKQMQSLDNPLFYQEYAGAEAFSRVLEDDLNRWLTDSEREWIPARTPVDSTSLTTLAPPTEYFDQVEREFQRLDIAGIDNDRSFEIPLSEVYVRLRVMFDQDTSEEAEEYDSGPIDIQTALVRYNKLVIVGDPGSGKSTFLKYIALMLARSISKDDMALALAKLSLPEPLPLPIFLSCWDLSDFLKSVEKVRLESLLDFIVESTGAYGFSTDKPEC